MPMRVNCKFYESRTYATGDTVRMCRLDLAPEAPWRCPEDCPRYERKVVDGGWTVGTLAQGVPDAEPPPLDQSTIALLDSAEDIINDAGPGIIAEVHRQRQEQRQRRRRRWWWPFS